MREDLGEVPKVAAGVRFYLLGVQQRQRAGAGLQLLARRPGARLASPISVSTETNENYGQTDDIPIHLRRLVALRNQHCQYPGGYFL